MTLRTTDPTRVRSLRWHLDQAIAIDREAVEQIRALADQLRGKPILPILGAGASYDCGMRLAREISEDLYEVYMGDSTYAPHEEVRALDLADVAQAIYNGADQVAVVRALGLPDHTLWPSASDIDGHFCAYRVLARLAREPAFEFDEAVGFNYDCHKEAALLREGFLLSAHTTRGRRWSDHARVIADGASFSALCPTSALTYIKAHGCAARYRELASIDEPKAAETIVVCHEQLTNWRNHGWIQERLRDRIRNRVLLLIGFSGQDPAVHGEFKTILNEVYTSIESSDTPRVVVIDAKPNTSTLQGLIKSGLGDRNPPDGTVTAIDVQASSTTAALFVLLAHLLGGELEPHMKAQGYDLSEELDPQLAALAIAAPIMLRWTYLLRPPAENEFIQKVNLEQAAENGYVPMLLDRDGAVSALRRRRELRRRLGLHAEEGTKDALAEHGFIVAGGFAYLPTALEFRELQSACRRGGPIERTRAILGHPTGLECLLVSEDAGELKGVNVETGNEVEVPA